MNTCAEDTAYLKRIIADHRRHTEWAQDRHDTVLGRRHLRALEALEDVVDWAMDNLEDPWGHPAVEAVVRALGSTNTRPRETP